MKSIKKRPGAAAVATTAAYLVLLCSACGHSAKTTPTQNTSQARRSPSSTAPSSTVPVNAALDPPAVTASSSALHKFSKARAQAALDLATKLAYYSVADPKLLLVHSAHDDIRDYADVTRYMTPQAIRYLDGYIRDQARNIKDASAVSGLALTLLNSTYRQPRQTSAAQQTQFTNPLTPRAFTEHVDPTVTLNADHTQMVVTGSCQVTLAGTHDGNSVYVTLTRPRFRYYIAATPSSAYVVGLNGWQSRYTINLTKR